MNWHTKAPAVESTTPSKAQPAPPWLQPRSLLPPPGPARKLAVATLVDRFGDGLFAVGGVLFFVRGLGLSAGEVALGLTAAGVVGLAMSVPIGSLADRLGARNVLGWVLILQALATSLFVTVQVFPVFIAVAVLAAVGQKAARGTSNALIAHTAGEHRVAVRAYLRSVANSGLALGALAGGVAVTIDTRAAYTILMLIDAATFAIAALIVATLPVAGHQQASDCAQTKWPALRDLRYLVVTALNGVMSLQYWVLPIAVPLWVATRTSAPRGVVAILISLNTAMIVLCQVWAGRNATTVQSAARHVQRAGVVFLVGFVFMAAATNQPTWPAVALLVLGTFVHTLGELWHAAGTFELSYGLAPPHAHGQYQGVFALGTGAAEALAPAVLVGTCIGFGEPGWLLLGVVLAGTGMAVPRAAAWASAPGRW